MADDEKIGKKKLVTETGPLEELLNSVDLGGFTYKQYGRIRDMVMGKGRGCAEFAASLMVGADLVESYLGRKMTKTEHGLLLESYVSFVTVVILVLERDALLCEENTCALRKSMEYMKAQLDILKGGTGDGSGNKN